MEEGKEKEICVTLADIPIFATGASQIPPIGFTEQPTIKFQPSNEEVCLFPTASTCSNELLLPTAHETFSITCFLELLGQLDLALYNLPELDHLSCSYT